MALADDVAILQQEMILLTEVLNNVQIAITNLATSEELRLLTLMKQKEIDTIGTKLNTLWNQVQVLAAEIHS